MGKDYFSRDYSLTGVASSLLVCVDDQPIVENWMEVDSSAFAWNFHKACGVGTTALSFSLFKAFFIASVVSLFEAVVKALSIASASRFFKVVWKSHDETPFSLQIFNVQKS
jgi:hypothetical protein